VNFDGVFEEIIFPFFEEEEDEKFIPKEEEPLTVEETLDDEVFDE
jgi:hypothetical protein